MIEKREAWFTPDGASFPTRDAAQAYLDARQIEEWLRNLELPSFESSGSTRLRPQVAAAIAEALRRDWVLVRRPKP
jgi:hypothetical protein